MMSLAMLSSLSRAFDPSERARLGGFFGLIVGIHIVGWGMLLSQASKYPALLGLGGLAYSFGLRHAFDADHISAIDNTTRKLLQEGKKPMGVGFFFSLGHSTVVFGIAIVLGFAVKAIVEGAVSFGVPAGEEFVPRLFQDWDPAHPSIRSVSVSRPTLDDVFMSFTGSSIRDAEEDQSKQRNRVMMQVMTGGGRR